MDLLTALQTIALYFISVVLPPVLGEILGVLAILVFGSWVVGLITRGLAAGARRAHVKPALVDLLSASVTAVGWVLIAAGVLQALNLSQLAFAIGGSISLVALGIATAASGNLGDIIAGVFLASDPDFGNGFVIKTNDIEGMIERIDLRKTRIRAEDGRLHVIPNKDIESSVWIVQKRADPPPPLIRRPTIPPILGRGRHPGDSESGAQSEQPTP